MRNGLSFTQLLEVVHGDGLHVGETIVVVFVPWPEFIG